MSFREQLEAALPEYLVRQRWFRAKTRSILHVNISSSIKLGTYVVLLLDVHYVEGEADLYLLPVQYNSEEGDRGIASVVMPDGKRTTVDDALSSAAFRGMLFGLLVTGATASSADGSLQARQIIELPSPPGVTASSLSKAEQSNTSIIYDSRYILKLFRKLEAGVNPDIEMGAFLASHGFGHTPAIISALEFQNNERTVFSAGILQRFVPNQGDAWSYTLRAIENKQGYAGSAKLLGKRTAEMHAALSSDMDNPDFAPETFTTAHAEELSHEIGELAHAVLRLLRDKLSDLGENERALAEQVISYEERIYDQIKSLANLRTDAQRIRHHGDYHLGQVLYTGSDFMIIDFEGEPARPLAERRAKALALRDVAGMLRSFQYAAYSARCDKPDDWCNETSRLYLDAYYDRAAAHGFLPSSREQCQSFLDIFLLQKALYEVNYELNNRPAWAGIPLRGIIGLIER